MSGSGRVQQSLYNDMKSKELSCIPICKIKPHQNRFFPSGGSLNVLLSTLLAFLINLPLLPTLNKGGGI